MRVVTRPVGAGPGRFWNLTGRVGPDQKVKKKLTGRVEITLTRPDLAREG